VAVNLEVAAVQADAVAGYNSDDDNTHNGGRGGNAHGSGVPADDVLVDADDVQADAAAMVAGAD
jgi:hypothetical protein